MWATGVLTAAHNALKGMGATAQAIFSPTRFGLGGTLGDFAGGVLYESLDSSSTFFVVGENRSLILCGHLCVGGRQDTGCLANRAWIH